MKVKTTNFINPEDEEKLTVVFILDDDDNEIERYSFYNEKREMSIEPELKTSLDRLPNLLHMIYNSGVKQENVEFITEDLMVN